MENRKDITEVADDLAGILKWCMEESDAQKTDKNIRAWNIEVGYLSRAWTKFNQIINARAMEERLNKR